MLSRVQVELSALAGPVVLGAASLIHNAPHMSTVLASEACFVLELRPQAYVRLCKQVSCTRHLRESLNTLPCYRCRCPPWLLVCTSWPCSRLLRRCAPLCRVWLPPLQTPLLRVLHRVTGVFWQPCVYFNELYVAGYTTQAPITVCAGSRVSAGRSVRRRAPVAGE
jgi:hypothetical protein